MPNALGSFTQEDIAGLAHDIRVPENAGISPTQRFVRYISDLVKVRLEVGEASGVSIILRSDALESDAEGREYIRHPYLRSGQDSLSQKVFMSNAVLGLAYAIPVDEADDEMLAVQKAGLGKLPALVIDWRGDVPRAALYGSGVDNSDDVQDIYLTESDISPADLKAGLDEFYNKRLRTPSLVVQGHSIRIWGEKPSQGWPADRPEERIQGVLMNHLQARYTRFDIRAETPNDDGRLDLKISAKLYDMAGEKIVKNVWVLELKALTDRTVTGNPVPRATVEEAIVKGLTQAISYKDADHINQAALCCFDMRATDDGDENVFTAIAEEANDNDIHLWRWFLFRGSGLGREAKRAARIAAAVKPSEG